MTIQELERPAERAESPASSATSPVPKPVIAFFAALRRIFGKPRRTRVPLRRESDGARVGSVGPQG